MGDRDRPCALISVRVVEDPQQAGADGGRRLDADLAAQDVVGGLCDCPSLPHEPAGQGAAGRVGAILDQEPQLGVCVGGPAYREDREVDSDSGARELLQIGRLRHSPILARFAC
jgi:hypothetical protein